jgi:hypothetical protein
LHEKGSLLFREVLTVRVRENHSEGEGTVTISAPVNVHPGQEITKDQYTAMQAYFS